VFGDEHMFVRGVAQGGGGGGPGFLGIWRGRGEGL
jgi:hypothetical protein